MRFGILGPLEVQHRDLHHRLTGTKQRTLLAALLVQANNVVSPEYLVSALWEDEPAHTRINALHTQVSRLRRRLDGLADGQADRLVSRDAGYVLRVREDELDAASFEAWSRRALAARAARGWTTAVDAAETALACWRGAALEEFPDKAFARGRATQLDEQRLVTLECRIDAGLALGRHRELTSDVQELVDEHPLRESFWCQLMLALYRSGRQGDALRAFERVRRLLAQELGIRPCAELAALERAVLDQDPSLDWNEAESPLPAPSPAADLRLAGPAPRDNLPRPLTSFVGRGAERAMVAAALEDSRLVTVSGGGGCGKTRLVLAVAEDVQPRFAGGVWFVDLTAVDDPSLVTREIARPLGSETGLADQLDYLCRRIGDDQVLLVLDNCEHLARSVAETVEQVLRRCGAVRVLTTSRDELGAAGEFAYRVPALSLPVADGDDNDPFLNSEAVQLFVERGRARAPAFSPTGDELDEIASICQRLQGIPLAIELAAAHVRELSVVDIAERLDDRFRLLDHGRRRLSRPQVLQTTLEWSYDLLDPEARAVFAQLPVLVDDFSLAAVQDVAGGAADRRAVVRALRQLTARSLLQQTSAGGDGWSDRYCLPASVRRYAGEQLEQASPAGDDARLRHARHYAAFAAQAGHNHAGPVGPVWLPRVVAELQNLRSAVTWALSHDELETAMRLVGGLRWYYARVGLLDAAAAWLDHGLARARELAPETRLRVLTAAGNAAILRGDFRRIRQLGEEGVALARQLGDEGELAAALVVRGGGVGYEGDLARADECFEEAHELSVRLDDRPGTAWTLASWGMVSSRAGRRARARGQLEGALELFRALDDAYGQVLPLAQLALDAHEDGAYDRAHTLAGEAARLATRLQDPQLQHLSLYALGTVELTVGTNDRARELLVRSVRLFPGARSEITVTLALERLARLASRAGRHGEAVALLGFVQRLQRGWQIPPDCPPDLENRRLLDAARSSLGVDRFEHELERGRAMELDEAIGHAEAATDRFPRSA